MYRNICCDPLYLYTILYLIWFIYVIIFCNNVLRGKHKLHCTKSQSACTSTPAAVRSKRSNSLGWAHCTDVIRRGAWRAPVPPRNFEFLSNLLRNYAHLEAMCVLACVDVHVCVLARVDVHVCVQCMCVGVLCSVGACAACVRGVRAWRLCVRARVAEIAGAPTHTH